MTRNYFQCACALAAIFFARDLLGADFIPLRKFDDQPAHWRSVEPSTDAPKRLASMMEDEAETVTVDADEVEFDRPANLIRARGNVVMRRGNVTLRCDRAEYNTATKIAIAEGNVILTRPGDEWRGPRLEYDFSKQEGEIAEFRGRHTPWFVGGGGSQKLTDRIVVNDAFLTTCEYEHPHWKLKAARVEIYPDRIVARGITLRVGDLPVFWFPYLRQSLKDRRPVLEIIPGQSARMGGQALLGYNWSFSDSLRGTVRADYRARRGAAGGLDFDFKLGERGAGFLQTYYANDKNPKDADDAGDEIGHGRYRIALQHRQEFESNVAALVRVNALSDPDVLEDFLEREFRREVQPDSFADVTLLRPTFIVSLLARPQVNEFFETTERLPEVRLEAVRQRVFGSPLYYESESSAGFLERNFASTSGVADFDAFRADSFHQVTLPQLWGGWLSVVPRAGGRVTHYTESAVANSPEVTRGVFNTGVEVATKAARTFDVKNEAANIHGLRHIFEPSVNYSYVPTPNRIPAELLQFDTVRPTTRLLPIEFPQYRAIEMIDQTNTLRPTLRNRLQTRRRDGAISDLVEWLLYADYRLTQPLGVHRWSDVFNEVTLRPTDWLAAQMLSRVDPYHGVLREFNSEVALLGGTDYALSVGQRFLQGDSHQIAFGVYARISENWSARTAHRIEARGRARLEEHEYAIERDLHCWTAAVSFRYRDERIGADDFRVMVVFTLKALPEFKVSAGK